MQRLVRDAHRAGDVIARIRGFLRRGELLPTRVDLEDVVGEVLGLVQAEARAQGVVLSHTPAPGLPAVRGDRVQLQQVILNLVMNALEAIAAAAHPPRVLAVNLSRPEASKAVLVEVRDSGVGIPPADRDRIFDAFHTSKPEGMGMGLAISRSIVEAHGGRLWATPNDGGGETFRFTLSTDGA